MEIWGRSSCCIGKFNGKGGSNMVRLLEAWIIIFMVRKSENGGCWTFELMNLFLNGKMHVTFMNLVAYNWYLVAEFSYGKLWNLWLLVDEI